MTQSLSSTLNDDTIYRILKIHDKLFLLAGIKGKPFQAKEKYFDSMEKAKAWAVSSKGL